MNLVQIKIPPLRQSTQAMMSCPKFYTVEVIENNHQPGGLDSAKGTQIHRTMALYLSFCALHKVSADLEAFDRFSRGAGIQAAKILAGLRDGFEVDHEHLFATELKLTLDEHFVPTNLVSEMQGIIDDSEWPPYYQGTLDGVFLFPDAATIRIDDFKSHAKPFSPDDTPQAKEYALLAFKHFPWANQIIFRLIFVRYKRVIREVTFTRDQLPALIDMASAAKERQKKLHIDFESGIEPEAYAGPHCWYCPLLTNAQCPIAKWNPQMQLSLQQRLNFYLWYSQFSRANNAVMRSFVQERDKSITLKDYNGKSYIFGKVQIESETYPVFNMLSDGTIEKRTISGVVEPVLPIIDHLFNYADTSPDDQLWLRNVVISSTSLKKYLKTNKRVDLDQAIEDTIRDDKVPKIVIRVSKPLDALLEEELGDEEFDEEEEM